MKTSFNFFFLLFAFTVNAQTRNEFIRPMMNASGIFYSDYNGKIHFRSEGLNANKDSDKNSESYVLKRPSSYEGSKNIDAAFSKKMDDGTVITTFVSEFSDGPVPSATTFQFNDGKVVGVIECQMENCVVVDSTLCSLLENNIESVSTESIQEGANKAFQKMNVNESKIDSLFKKDKKYEVALGRGLPTDQNKWAFKRLCRNFNVDIPTSSNSSSPSQNNSVISR